ncbi:hypothetical protein CYMTET_3833, partial [Cymbomonas tetramitiformis]
MTQNLGMGANVTTGPFTVRLVDVDYYMAAPIPGVDVCYSALQGSATQQVPVVRVFGATPAGQKTCLHIHQAFPYFYVPFEGPTFPQEVSRIPPFLRQFALALDQALETAAASHQLKSTAAGDTRAPNAAPTATAQVAWLLQLDLDAPLNQRH